MILMYNSKKILVVLIVVSSSFLGAFSKPELDKIIDSLEVEIDGEGESIVMIHGFPDDLTVWDELVDHLSDEYKCIRLTLPGFEKVARKPEKGYTIKEMRQIINHFIEVLPERKVVVLAHDWGAVYSKVFLRKHPKVSKLILLDIGDFGKQGMPPLNKKYTLFLGLSWLLPNFLASPLIDYPADSLVGFRNVDPYIARSEIRREKRLTFPYFYFWLSYFQKTLPKPVRITDYETPLLFIYGKEKQKISFHSKLWANEVNSLPDSKTIAMSGGHWMMKSHPRELSGIILDWLD